MSHITINRSASLHNAASAKHKKIVYFICIVAALGGLLFGLDQGFIANSLETISKSYHLSMAQSEHYAASLAWGAILGALLSGLFARFLGRKKSLIFAGFLFSLCSGLSATLPPLNILILCRFFLGFGVGVASFVVPMYLSETAPSSIRGAMGTLFQLMIAAGIFLISITNVEIAKLILNISIALPLMFIVIAVFAFIMFIGAFFLPESPRWLMLRGKTQKAKKVLTNTLNNSEEVSLSLAEIEATISSSSSILKTLCKPYFIKILVVGILLQMFQQLVGINLMIYYSPTIFKYANLTGFLSLIIVPTVFLVFTFPAIKLVEKLGRKKLLYIGAVIMLVTMFIAGVCFQNIGHSQNTELESFIKLMLFVSVIVYTIGFAFTWGPVVWLLCSEIFPLEVREVGMTITTMVNWTFAGLVMYFSLTVMEKFGNPSIFYIFTIFCIIAIFFVRFLVPETRGISLEELENSLKSGIKLSKIGGRKIK